MSLVKLQSLAPISSSDSAVSAGTTAPLSLSFNNNDDVPVDNDNNNNNNQSDSKKNKNKNRNQMKKYKYKTPETDAELTAVGDHYKSLNAWIKDQNFVRSTSNQVEALSHTGLDGNIYCIPITESKTFHYLLARDMSNPQNQESQTQFYICEFLTSVHAWFCDFDIINHKQMNEKDWFKLQKIIHNKMRICFPDPKQNLTSIWCLTKEAITINENKEKLYKYGLHIVWPFVVVKTATTKWLYIILLAEINLYMTPKPQPPSNSWNDRFDRGVYGSDNINTGGLRLPGCTKMGKCPKCKSKNSKRKATNLSDITTGNSNANNKKNPNKIVFVPYTNKNNIENPDYIECKFCFENNGKFSTGRKYNPLYVFDNDGNLDHRTLSELKISHFKTLEMCHLRRNQTLFRESDFVMPESYPPIPGDDNYDEDDDDRKYIQQQRLQLQNHKLGSSSRNHSNSNSNLNSNSKSHKINDSMNINGEIKTGMLQYTEIFRRGEDENDITSDDQLPEILPTLKMSDKVPKSYAHLHNLFEFEETRETILEMKPKFKYTQKNPRINNLIQGMIRDYNSNYKYINVVDVRSNTQAVKKHTQWIIYVDGVGSNWCLNKGGTHNSAHIYFQIIDGKIFHRCSSKKQISRVIGNCKCEDYRSCPKYVDDVIMRALSWVAKQHPNFMSVDDELMFGKFESIYNRYFQNRVYIEKFLGLDPEREFFRDYEQALAFEHKRIDDDNHDLKKRSSSNSNQKDQLLILSKKRELTTEDEQKVDIIADLCEDFLRKNFENGKYDKHGNPIGLGIGGMMNFSMDENFDSTLANDSFGNYHQTHEANEIERKLEENYMKELYLINFNAARNLGTLPEEVLLNEDDDIHNIKMVEINFNNNNNNNNSSGKIGNNIDENKNGNGNVKPGETKPKRKYVRKKQLQPST